jgi:hypothetical protein
MDQEENLRAEITMLRAVLAAEKERADAAEENLVDGIAMEWEVRKAAEAREAALREALEAIAERTDVDVNGEYIVRDQPALSAAEANTLARSVLALARTAGEQP